MTFLERMQKHADKRKAHDPDSKHGFTMGDTVNAILEVSSMEDAKDFFDGYVEDITCRRGKSQEEAEGTARSNIGFCFGEGMSKKRIAMWIQACGAAHPVFGTVMPSGEQAFKMGQAHGERAVRS